MTNIVGTLNRCEVCQNEIGGPSAAMAPEDSGVDIDVKGTRSAYAYPNIQQQSP